MSEPQWRERLAQVRRWLQGRRIASWGAREWAVLLAALALAIRLPLFFDQTPLTTPYVTDSLEYDTIAEGLLSGAGFETHTFRTPGYPVFVAGLKLLPGGTEDTVAIAQHLLGVALVVAIVLLSWPRFGRVPAVLAGLLATISPVMVTMEHWVLADMLFACLVFAGAWALAFALLRRPASLRLLALAGVLFGLATLVKPVGQALLIAPPLALLLTTRDWRQTLRGSVAAAAAMVITFSPWIVNNVVTEDYPGLTRQGSLNLFYRVFARDDAPIPLDSEEGRIVAAHGGGDVIFEQQAPTSEFEKRGISFEGMLDRFGSLARTAIRRDLPRYAEGTLVQTWMHRDLAHLWNDDVGVVPWAATEPHFDTYHPDLRSALDRADWPLPKELPKAAWRVGDVITDAVMILALQGLAALLLLLTGSLASRAAAAALFSTWLAIAVGSSLGGVYEDRYAADIAPLGWILVAAGAMRVLEALWTAVGRTRPVQDE